MPKFTHLHTHSHYSLLDGLAKIDDLVDRAKTLGMNSLALTDHGNLHGSVEFYKKAKKAGLKPILGVEAYIDPETESGEFRYHHLTLLAENETGWKNLVKLVTIGHLEGEYLGEPRIDREHLAKYAEGLICLSGCINGAVNEWLHRNDVDGALEYWHDRKFHGPRCRP